MCSCTVHVHTDLCQALQKSNVGGCQKRGQSVPPFMVPPRRASVLPPVHECFRTVLPVCLRDSVAPRTFINS